MHDPSEQKKQKTSGYNITMKEGNKVLKLGDDET